jgi:putative DNA-invertase from lambdoid prophage Rac
MIVTQMDRLGRKHDRRLQYGRTVWRKKLGVRAHCLALGTVDLTNPAGRMTMTMISAVAQFERDQLIERTQSALKRRFGHSALPMRIAMTGGAVLL